MNNKKNGYITSYFNPDTDGICSAICYSELLKNFNKNYEPVFFGAISEETKYVLMNANIDYSLLRFNIEIESDMDIILLDTHHINQLPFIKDLKKVIEIIDHHPEGDDEKFENAIITNMDIGAVATIIGDLILRENFMNSNMALIIGSAIISNTCNFKAPSTSKYDLNIFDKIKEYYDFDENYINSMVKSNDNIIFNSIESAISRETKIFKFNNEKIAVSQLEIHTFLNEEKIKEIYNVFKKIISIAEIDRYIVNIIDYSTNRTIFITCNSISLDIIHNIFGDYNIGEIYIVDEILMRKDFISSISKKVPSYSKIGIIHGRFQCLHNGHMEYLLAGKSRCDFLYIGITNYERDVEDSTDSTNPSRLLSDHNPFSYFERMEMIEGSLMEAGVSKDSFKIIPFPIEKPEKIREFTPKDAVYFITIYDDWGKSKLFKLKNLGLNVEVMWERTPEDRLTSGTEVRALIKKSGDWEKLVPSFVYRYIKDNKLEKRIE